MQDRRARLLGFCVLVACFLLADTTPATTIIPMSDEDLVASSQVIVEGRCLRIRSEWNADRTAIFTRITFLVTKVIKGDVQPGTIVIKQLGGQVADGATIIWGAPYWQKDWEMLLFLNPEPEEGLRVAHLSLGYFRVLRDQTTGTKFVARALPGPNVRILGDRPYERYEPLDAFVTRIELLAAAGGHKDSTAVAATEPVTAGLRRKSGSPTSDFRFLSPGFRWFEPDTGDRIRFSVNRSRAPNPSGGFDEARAAANAWSAVPGSSLRVEISGQTDACGLRVDGANAISFNDCTGRFDTPVNCSGVVAVGGVAQAVTNQSVSIGGRTFARIQDADIIFNPGFACLLGDSAALAEIMTHEMGHTLGFGHSSEQVNETSELLRDATLFLIAHLDGRGASLRTDDMDGARFLYRAAPSTDPLAIATDALPDARTGAPYAFDLKATGSGPFTWSIVEGQLPDGLSLSAGGRIAGTAAVDASATFTVSVRDNANFALTRSLQFRCTGTPAPFIASVKYSSATGKLTITALNVDETAEISINGIQIAPPRTVKFKASKGRLTVSGSTGELNVRTGAPNAVVVTVRGLASNTFAF